MPAVLFDRRVFLGMAWAGAAAQTADRLEARVALLADTHVSRDAANEYRGFRPAENLKKVAAQVAAWKPAAALVCGDLARLEGLPGDYDHLAGLLQPLSAAAPVYLGLGNHDHRKNFREGLGQSAPVSRPLPGRQALVAEQGPVRIVLLDSLLEANVTPGHLGKAQREWLEQLLALSDAKPTLVFVHHPPNDDDGNLLDAERLLRIVKPHAQVKAIFYGHTHEYRFHEYSGGLHFINIPAVGYNFRDSAPVGWVEARLREDGASFTLRAIGGNLEGNGESRSVKWR